ncbi:MAG: hypothetical protein J7623_23050 [Chitinophaga sp.]|uniref:hypothetical protein n=1 Tax=Chitinophaga sp. TaxID=1869181 RepID=UPI001B048CE3|nr:hypothetical protein [Chitinophaga sp.]MBO9731537.1 hypothetical protein [Chitinophaga sp.]
MVDSTHHDPAVNSCVTPVTGNRFVLYGDFDGDGQPDTLTEHFFSEIDNRETNKYYKDMDYDLQVRLNDQQEPCSFMTCSNDYIDTLNTGNGGVFGLSWLKNEGDLNGDGTDEVSYISDWADWSNLNTCHLVTWRRHRWEELYRFPINELSIPDTGDSSGAGTHFPGFIRKIKPGKMMVQFDNMGTPDSAIIRIR